MNVYVLFYVCAQHLIHIAKWLRLYVYSVHVSNIIMVDGSSMLAWLLATTSAYVTFQSLCEIFPMSVCVCVHVIVCEKVSFLNIVSSAETIWFGLVLVRFTSNRNSCECVQLVYLIRDSLVYSSAECMKVPLPRPLPKLNKQTVANQHTHAVFLAQPHNTSLLL